MKRNNDITREIVYRESLDKDGRPRCLSCRSLASDIHEILPRSFYGPANDASLFAADNRCCLCRKCHDMVHNDYGRGKLLYLKSKILGYKYEDEHRKWLIDLYKYRENLISNL